MKIANIVYEGELINHTKVDYINYYKGEIEYDNLNTLLPTLYVGWSFMKKCNLNNDIIQNADILMKKIISNTLYWEFSYGENKSSHVNGVENFVINAPEYFFKPQYKYTNLDPIFFQISDVDDLMYIVPKNINDIYIYKNEMIYLLSDKYIIGVDIKIYEFFKFDIKNIINRLIDRCNNNSKVIMDVEGDIYQKYYKIFPNFTQLKRYVVTLL